MLVQREARKAAVFPGAGMVDRPGAPVTRDKKTSKIKGFKFNKMSLIMKSTYTLTNEKFLYEETIIYHEWYKKES